MHSIRTKNDERGHKIHPNAKSLELDENNNVGKIVLDDSNSRLFVDWTGVVTNPALFCKDKLF